MDAFYENMKKRVKREVELFITGNYSAYSLANVIRVTPTTVLTDLKTRVPLWFPQYTDQVTKILQRNKIKHRSVDELRDHVRTEAELYLKKGATTITVAKEVGRSISTVVRDLDQVREFYPEIADRVLRKLHRRSKYKW